MGTNAVIKGNVIKVYPDSYGSDRLIFTGFSAVGVWFRDAQGDFSLYDTNVNLSDRLAAIKRLLVELDCDTEELDNLVRFINTHYPVMDDLVGLLDHAANRNMQGVCWVIDHAAFEILQDQHLHQAFRQHLPRHQSNKLLGLGVVIVDSQEPVMLVTTNGTVFSLSEYKRERLSDGNI